MVMPPLVLFWYQYYKGNNLILVVDTDDQKLIRMVIAMVIKFLIRFNAGSFGVTIIYLAISTPDV